MMKTRVVGVLAVLILSLSLIVTMSACQQETTDEVYTEGLQYSLNADGKSYTVIGPGACQDALIVIPPTHNGKPVVEIGKKAFCDNERISRVVIPDTVTVIGEAAFASCTSLASVTMGKSVTKIAKNAFGWCESLNSVTMPATVMSIGQGAFWSCKSLETIEFGGTVEQWKAIEKHFSWSNYSKIHYVKCTNGLVES